MRRDGDTNYLRVTAWAFTALVGLMMLAALLGGFDSGGAAGR
jgi:hypothetical protein